VPLDALFNSLAATMGSYYVNTKDGPHLCRHQRGGKGPRGGGAERMVWGTRLAAPDSKKERKPDDAVVIDFLAERGPDERTRHRILVENPEVLYGFPKG
jgi:hypothetical protein